MSRPENSHSGPESYGIDHRELPRADEASIAFSITNPNASNRQELSGLMPHSFPLQSANFWFVFPERSTINSNPIGDRYAFA
jgi:hypothetical protein